MASAGFGATIGSGTARAEDEPPPEVTLEPTTTPTPTPCPPADLGGAPPPAGSQSIGGTLTDGTNPLPGIRVRLFTSANQIENTITTASGEYLFTDLGDATYYVAFFDPNAVYGGGFYDAGPLALAKDDATAIELTGAGASGIDAALQPETSSTVSGVVTDSGGSGVGGVLVDLYGKYFPIVGCTYTNGDGSYQVTGLRSGAYSGRASKPGYPTVGPVDPSIAVPPDDTTVDFQFPPLHSLSGQVLTAGGSGVPGIWVVACETTTNQCGSGSSDEAGDFQVPGLVEGSYTVRYEDGTGTGTYRAGYYGGPGTWVETAAEAVTVAVPGDSVVLRAVPSPVVSGTITPVGLPQDTVLVLLCDVDGNCFGAYPDEASGDYSIRIPIAGTYIAQVIDYTGTHPNAYIGAGGTAVGDPGLALEIVVGGADITLPEVALPDGGRILVNVFAGTQDGASVSVDFCLDELSCPNSTSTDEFGDAASPVMFEGPYYVRATTDYEHFFWYVGDAVEASSDFADAAAVAVVANADTAVVVQLPAVGTATDAGPGVAPVAVQLDDGSGTSPVTMTFPDVTASGVSSLTTSENGDPIPDGFQLGLPATYYDISTTAAYVAPITICISYAGVSYRNEAGLRFWHYDSSIPGWDDITTTLDTVTDTICGETNSLSPFVIVERQMVFNGFLQPVDNGVLNKMKAGAAVPVKFSLGGDFGLDIFAEGSPTVSVVSCANPIVDTIEQTVAAGTAQLTYDASTNRYTYVFKTMKSWAGTCRQLELTFSDGSSHSAVFQFTK